MNVLSKLTATSSSLQYGDIAYLEIHGGNVTEKY